MVKSNAAIYVRKSSDDGTLSSDDQLHDLDVIGYAIGLSRSRRTPKFDEDEAAA